LQGLIWIKPTNDVRPVGEQVCREINGCIAAIIHAPVALRHFKLIVPLPIPSNASAGSASKARSSA